MKLHELCQYITEQMLTDQGRTAMKAGAVGAGLGALGGAALTKTISSGMSKDDIINAVKKGIKEAGKKVAESK